MTTIYSAHRWHTNAELVADVARLYLHRDMRAVDVTYGLGKWWTIWKPRDLVAHGLALDHPEHYDDGVDYRNLPEPEDTYDLAAFDPSYVARGGADSRGAAGVEMAARYGMNAPGYGPADNQATIDAGLAELWRVLRPARRAGGRYIRGVALVKCQSYISSGRLWPGVLRTASAAEAVGFRITDVIEHLSATGGPQPKTNRDGSPRRQVHTKRNHSTLLVLTKGPKP